MKQIKRYEERRKTRVDKTAEQIDFERSQGECTFKPNANRKKSATTRAQRSNDPILVANIQIGLEQETAKLVIYDTQDIPSVVSSFCSEHGKIKNSCNVFLIDLNGEVNKKLMELIQSQICASCKDNKGITRANPTRSVISY